MSKQLIIAEKPSVAQDIAKALGGFSKQGEYFEKRRLRAVVGHRPPARADRAGGI
jgi:DNA topoisomerase-3